MLAPTQHPTKGNNETTPKNPDEASSTRQTYVQQPM
jgi:hypothetical protein